MSEAGFRRVVYGLSPGTLDRKALKYAADLARLLHLELHALFIQDVRLAALVQSGNLREFQVLQSRWRSIEGGDLRRDLELGASIVQRLFEAAANAVGVASHFEVRHGTIMEAMNSVHRAADILIAPITGTPADFTGAASRILDAALARRSTVLLLPRSIIRERGPVLAITDDPNDAVAAGAAAIAAAMREEIDIRAPDQQRMTSLHWSHRRVGERMIVLSRAALDGIAPLVLASRRQVPVLVIEPADLAA
jgi:hypothetical protein